MTPEILTARCAASQRCSAAAVPPEVQAHSATAAWTSNSCCWVCCLLCSLLLSALCCSLSLSSMGCLLSAVCCACVLAVWACELAVCPGISNTSIGIFFRGPSGPTLLAASNITGQIITYSTLLLTSNVHPWYNLMSLLVESLHMRIDSETVYWSTGVGFIRRRFSFIFPRDLFVHPCFSESCANLSRPSSSYKCCVLMCNLSTFQGYITCLI